MPKVPVYQRQTEPSLRLNATKFNVSTSPDAFGGAMGSALVQGGQQLNQLSDALTKHALDLKAKHDSATVADLTAKAKQAAIAQYNDGLFQAKGKDASGLFKNTREDFTTFRQQFEGMAENDTQRAALKRELDSLGVRLSENAATIQAREMKAYGDAVKTGSIQVAGDEAAANYNDMNLVMRNKQQVEKLTDELVISKFGANADQSVKDAAKTEALTKYHQNIITKMLADDDPKKAKAYFEMFRGEMDPTTQKSVRDILRGEVDLKEAQGLADTVMTMHGGNMQAALQWVRDNSEGEVESKTEAIVRQRFSDKETQRAKYDRDRVESVSEKIKNSASLADAEILAQKYGKTPSEVNAFRSLATTVHETEYKTREATRSFEATAQMDAAEAQLKAQGRAYIDATIRQRGAAPTEMEIAKALGGKLKGPALKAVIDYAVKGGKLGNVAQSSINTIFKTFTTKKADDKTYQAQLDAVFEYVVDRVPDGTEPDDTLLRKLVAQAMLKGEADGSGFWDDTMTLAEAIKEGYGDIWEMDWGNIPDGENQKKVSIQAFENLNGKKPTPQELQKFYLDGGYGEYQRGVLASKEGKEAAAELRKMGKKVTYDQIDLYIREKAKE